MTAKALTRALDGDSDSDDAVAARATASNDEELLSSLQQIATKLRVSRTQFAEYCRARAEELDDISSDGVTAAVEACERLKAGKDGAFEDVAKGLARTARALEQAKVDAAATANAIESELEGESKSAATVTRDEDMDDATVEDAAVATRARRRRRRRRRRRERRRRRISRNAPSTSRCD